MNALSIFCLILAIIYPIICNETTDENEETPFYEGILDLTRDNYHAARAEHDFLLVKFYATWCQYSRALAPEYIKTAKFLIEQGSPIKFAQIDSSDDDTISKELEIAGYPTIMFFRQGILVEYFGNRTFEDLVSWLDRKMGPLAKELTTIEETKQFLESHDIATVGFFKDRTSDNAKEFLTTAINYEHSAFGITSEDSIFKEHNAKEGSIFLFKKHDDEKIPFDLPITTFILTNFLKAETVPFVIDLNPETSEKVFDGSIQNHLLVFYSSSNDKSKEIIETARSIAKPFRGQIQFVSVDIDIEPHVKIIESFGIRPEEIPAVRVIKVNKALDKFKPETDDLSAQSIDKFIRDALNDNIEPYFLEQSLPEDWDKHAVLTLVASNFDKVTQDSTKHVLVEFCASEVKQCLELYPIFDKVGQHLKIHNDFVVARIDLAVNELATIKLAKFPSIQLYTKGENIAIEYRGEHNFEKIVRFAESEGKEQDAEVTIESEDYMTKEEL